MSYCPNCNSPLPQGAEICPNCNAPVNQAENNAPNPQNVDYSAYQQNFNQNPNMYQTPPQEEKANVGLAILSFIIPIAGLIIFLTQKDKKPKTAKVSGICALVSVIINLVLSIVMGVAGGLLLGSEIVDDNLDVPGYFEDYDFDDDYDYDDDIVGGSDGSDNIIVDGSDKNKDEKTSNASNGKNDAKEFSVGVVENNVYTNTFTNIKYVLPDDDWSFSSYDELLSSTDGAEIDEETGATVVDEGIAKSYFAAIASQASTGTNVQFMIFESKTRLTSMLDADDYLETVVETVVSGDDTAVKSPDNLTCKIGTETYSRIDAVYNSQGVDIAQTYLCQKIGNYYSIIIITSADGGADSIADECISHMSNAN